METQTQNRQATARDLVTIVFRQKWIILTVFAVTTAAVFLVNLRTPTTYESSARVQVRRGRMENTQQRNLRLLSWEEEMASELEAVGSYPVTKRAQDIVDKWYQEGLLGETLTIHRGGIEARVIGESSVLEISYASLNPDVCRPATNALTEAYTEFRQEALIVPGVDDFFAREMTRIEFALAAAEDEKRAFLSEIGAVTENSSKTRLNNLLLKAQTEEMDVESELTDYQRQLDAARMLNETDDAEVAYIMEMRFSNLGTLLSLRDAVMRARLRRDELQAKLTPAHPDMIAAQETLDSAEGLLEKEINSTVSVLESRITSLTERLSETRAEVAMLSSEVESVPASAVRLEQLNHQIQMLRGEMIEINRNQTVNRVNQATAPKVTVVLMSPASSPYAKQTRDMVRMGLAPLMSLVVGFLLAFFVDSIDHTLRNEGDVQEHLGLPVLASLPETKS